MSSAGKCYSANTARATAVKRRSFDASAFLICSIYAYLIIVALTVSLYGDCDSSNEVIVFQAMR